MTINETSTQVRCDAIIHTRTQRSIYIYSIIYNVFSERFFQHDRTLQERRRRSSHLLNRVGPAAEILMRKDIDLRKYNAYEGRCFESACAEYLRACGFRKIKLTKGSGDQGVDIIATYRGELYAVQCKYYSKNVGNKAVQEVYSGMQYHGCDRAIVMTNAGFTRYARELAESLEVVTLLDNISPSPSGRLSPYAFGVSFLAMGTVSGLLHDMGYGRAAAGLVLAWLLLIVALPLRRKLGRRPRRR